MKESNPAIWAGFEAPEGHNLAWRVVHPDGRSRGDFQWPFKGVVKCRKAEIIDHQGPCPLATGDGVCLAKSWYGAASGGIHAVTGLAVAYRDEDVLGRDEHKLRVKRAVVLGAIDLQRLLREGHGAKACLGGANLRRANLRRANLADADLRRANLRGADLYGANLAGANLYGANLAGADLAGADLRGAYLAGADLRGADLRGAYLAGATGYEAQ